LDPWILSQHHDCINLGQKLRIQEHRAIKKTFEQWYLAANGKDKDLSQSALTEAHGDCTGGQTGTWESWIGKRRPFLMRDYWAKPLDKEKALKHSITWKLGKPWGKALKAKGGTHAPKPIVYQGHPWAVSGFGEKRAIPFSARRVAGGGERKPPLIAH